jgi:hypothetical protein
MPEAMLITGNELITRAELAMVPTPASTPTHQTIPHVEVVEAVVNTLGLRKLAVVAEQHTVDRSGLKYWGTLDLEAMGEGMRFSIGIRNSHDRSMSLALIAGYRVMVCQNGCFSGDFLPVMRKHTKNMNLIESVTLGVDSIQRGWEPLVKQVRGWQERQLSDAAAKLLIYEAFVEGAMEIPKHLAYPVHQAYFNPPYPDFAPRNMWSLQNSFTQAVKALDPIPRFRTQAAIGHFFEAR